MTRNKHIYMGMVVLQAFIFGVGNALTKVAYESISPFWSMFFRFGLALALFLLFFGKGVFAELRKAPPSVWLPSSICVSATYILCNLALDRTTATNVGFLMSLSILFVPFFEAVVMKRAYRAKYAPAQLLVILGLYLLCSNGGDFTFGIGELFGLLSSAAMAGALVYGEKGLQNMDVMAISTIQIGLTVLLSLAGALLMEPGFRVETVEPEAWLVLLYLSIGSTCGAFWLQNKALTALSSTQVSLILCSEPVFTAIVSFMLLAEALSGAGLAGTGIIIGCIVAETYILSSDAAASPQKAPEGAV